MLIARYFGEPSREGEILRLSEKAAERLLADRSVALLLRELDRDSPKAWRELLLLAFVSLVTLSDRPLEQPEVLLVVTRGLDVNIEEVLARPDTTLAFTKFWPSEPETTSTSTSRAPATSYTSNEVVGFLANDSVRIIDVRDAGSFGRHRIPSAVFIEPSLVVERLKDEARPVVLYCRSGDVSKGIADDLARHRDGVGWLAGGYIAWEVTGHRIERP